MKNTVDYQLISEKQEEAINYYKEAFDLIRKSATAIQNGGNAKEFANLILIAVNNTEIFAENALIEADPNSETEPANLDEYRERYPLHVD